MYAELVCDGTRLRVPAAMGTPKPGQLVGTPLEQLSELCCRVCYDSLGTGRSSEALHEHILQVGHLSVYWHATFTVCFEVGSSRETGVAVETLLNRKGVWLERSRRQLEVTINLQAVIEWDRYTRGINNQIPSMTRDMGNVFRWHAHRLAPLIVPPPDCHDALAGSTHVKDTGLTDDQAFVSIFMSGSRGFCYLPDTEALTKEGWKPVTQVRDGEYILTKDPVTGKARWSVNKKTHALDYAGRVYWMESSQWVSPAVTREHLMWAAKYDLRDGRRGLSCEAIMDGYAEKIPMERLSGRRFIVDHRISMEDVKNPETITIDGFNYSTQFLFAFLGWMATDGCTSGGRCRIAQTKEWTKPTIRALLTNLFGNDWSERESGFDIHREVAGWVVEMIGPLKENRDLTPLYSYSPKLINAFLDAAVLGDGNSNININGSGEHDVIYVGYRHLALQYQVLYALTGRSCNIREDDRIGMVRVLQTGQVWTNENVGYVVSTHWKGVSIVKKEHHRCTHYTGKVFCPQTEDGLIYVRREGMAFWCANSHEQVRHNYAVSQRSTRYCDEYETPWVEHPLVTAYLMDEYVSGESRAHVERLVRKSVEAGREAYRQLIIYLEDWLRTRGSDKVTARKQARGAARGYLGNALNTELIFTATVAGWRDMIRQRKSRFADAEIRQVYGPVIEALVGSRYGDRFQDVVTVSSPDGLGYVLSA